MRSSTLLLFAAALAACSRPTVGEYPDDYEAALCEWATECSAFRSESQCREALIWDAFPGLTYLEQAAAAGRVEFSRSRAADCLDALAVQPCEEGTLQALLYDGDLARAPAVCREVYVGKVRNYDPCMRSEECDGVDPVCGFDPTCSEACCVGACRDRGRGPEAGEACNGICAPSLYCARDPETFQFTVCEPLRDAGGACDFGDECAEGLYCGSDRRCAALKQVSQGCDYNDQCAEGLICTRGACAQPGGEGDPCDPDEWRSCRRSDNQCDEVSRRCVRLQEPGEPCSYDCVAYADCIYFAEEQRCVSRASLGEACGARESGGESYYVDCVGHLVCAEGICDEPELAAACPVPE